MDEKNIITQQEADTDVSASELGTKTDAENSTPENAANTSQENPDSVEKAKEQKPTAPVNEHGAEKSDLAEQADNAKKIATLEGKVHALSSGVSADSIDDVLTLAQSKVSGEITLDKAIDLVVEKYPQFKATSGEKQVVTTSVPTNNDPDNSADDERVNKIMGIK